MLGWTAVDIPMLAALPALLLLSGFFSGSETALFGLTETERMSMRRAGSRATRAAEALLGNERMLLITILLGNMTVNVLYFVITSVLLMRAEVGVLAGLLLAGFFLVVIIVVGEVTPKLVANAQRVRLAGFVGPPLLALHRLIRKWVGQRATIPVFASTYAKAVHSAHEQCRIRRTPTGWIFEDFGHCRCVRVDDEDRPVDWSRSTGLVGARRLNGSLYLQLRGRFARVEFSDTPVSRPHIEQSDHELQNVRLVENGLRCHSRAFRRREVVFAGLPAKARFVVKLSGTTREGRADDNGRYRLIIEQPGSMEMELHLR